MLIKLIGAVFSRKSTKLRQASTSEFYSVIVCSVDDRRFACLRASLGQAFADQSYELIRISGAQSLCQGYNEGMKRSRGSRLIFCHDDIEIVSEDFVARLEANFACFDVFGPVGTTRLIEGNWSAAGHPDIHGSIIQPDRSRPDCCALHLFSETRRPVPGAQALDGVFIAATRAAAEQLGWDAASIPGFHLYDIDFSFRAHLAGLRVGIATDLLLFHESANGQNEEWIRTASQWNRRYAARLSRLPPGPSSYRLAIFRDRESAYECFVALLGASSENG